MNTLNTLDIIVDDVAAAARLLVDVFEAEEQVNEPGFAQVALGGMTIMFSRTAMVPLPACAGVILHLEVEDPRTWAAAAVRRGGTEVHPYTETEWGTRSVMLQGPAGVVIDVFSQASGA